MEARQVLYNGATSLALDFGVIICFQLFCVYAMQ